MRTHVFISLLLFFSPQNISAQHNTIDSLEKVLLTEKGDTNKVNEYIDLAREFRYIKADSAVYFINLALDLAQKLKFEMGIADSKRGIATLYADGGTPDEGIKASNEALILYNKLLSTAKATEKNKIFKDIGFTYIQLGNSRFSQGNYPEALKYSLLALKISEQLGDQAAIGAIEFNIGNIYYCQHNYPEALKHDFVSLNITKRAGDKASIATCYDEIGLVYFDQGNHTEALKNYAVSLKLAEESKDKYAMAEIYIDLGVMYLKQDNYNKALKYDFDALQLFKEIKFNWQFSFIYNNIAGVYLKQKKYNSAAGFLKKALLAAKTTGHSEYIKLSYETLEALDSAQGNFKQALKDYKLVITYRDSLINRENTKKTMQQQMQYEFDKKEDSTKAAEDKKEAIAKAEIRTQKTIRNFSYAGAFAMLSIASVGFYRYKKRRKLQSQQEMLNERLRISRELHDDIGSTLGSISIYSEVAKSRSEKKENADEAVVKIGNASRELIDKMSDIVWSLNPNNESFEQLLNRIQVFAAMMLTPHGILYTIDSDEHVKYLKLTTEERKNIYLIYKEAIHNIIKYAECTQVEIKILLGSEEFVMSVKDNGKGFDANELNKTNESLGGNGIRNMQARAAIINARLSINSNKSAGTSVKLITPL